METPQKPGHPDIFTPAEAAAYLRLETEETLVWLREQAMLSGARVGKATLYHREALDACARRMFGLPTSAATPGAVGRPRLAK